MHCSRTDLLDRLVGAGTQRRWNGETEQLGSLIKAERSPAAFERVVRSEMTRWAPLLAASQAKP
jgi:hypothetical protein